jgi:hypothetical protein
MEASASGEATSKDKPQIVMRLLLSSSEASAVIGRKGKNIEEIKRLQFRTHTSRYPLLME